MIEAGTGVGLLAAGTRRDVGRRATFVVARRLLSGLQPLFLVVFIGTHGVAIFAALIALQQLLYSAAVTGWGWSVYSSKGPPQNWWHLALRNALLGVPGLLGGCVAVAFLPIASREVGRPHVLVVLGVVVVAMKIDELSHSVLDRFVSVYRAEAVGLIGTTTSTLIVVLLYGEATLPTVILVAIAAQVSVQVVAGALFMRSARRNGELVADASEMSSIRPGVPEESRRRRAVNLDQITGNLLAQLQILLLQRVAPSGAFGFAYAASRPVSFAAGGAANVATRSLQGIRLVTGSRARSWLLRAYVTGLVCGLIVGVGVQLQVSLYVALTAALCLDAAIRPWFLFTSVAAEPGETLALARDLSRARLVFALVALILASAMQETLPVLALAWGFAFAQLTLLVAGVIMPTRASSRC